MELNLDHILFSYTDLVYTILLLMPPPFDDVLVSDWSV